LKLKENLQKAKTAFQQKKKKTKRKLILSALAIVLAVSFGVNYWMKSSASGNETTYEDVAVERRDITVTLTGTGTVSPVNQYEVKALVSGDVLAAPFEEGDVVEKGDPLYTIDTSNVENSIEKARVSVEKAQKSYNETLETKKNLNVTSDISGVIQELYVEVGDSVSNGAQIALVNDNSTMLLKVPFNSNDAAQLRVGQSASVTLDGSFETLSGTVSKVSNVESVLDGNMLVRYVTISVKNPGAITSDSYGTAVVGGFACNSGANFEPTAEKTISAKASGEVGKIYYDEGASIKSGATIVNLTSTSIDTEISTAALSLKDAELSLQNTIDEMDDYNITSPISGTVIEKDYKVGDTIDSTSSGTTLAIIYDLSSLVFEMSIDELDVGLVEVGQEVSITADALEGQTFTGTVDTVSINGTTSNGVTTYPVTVSVKDADGLLPGMNINASIVVESAENVLAIPLSAVSRGNLVLLKDGGSGGSSSGNTDTASPANTTPGDQTSGQNASGTDSAGTNSSMPNQSGTNASAAPSSNKDVPDGYTWVKVELGINNEDYIEVKSGLDEGDTIAIVKVATESTSTQTATTSTGMGMGGGMMGGGGGEPPSGGGGPGGPMG